MVRASLKMMTAGVSVIAAMIFASPVSAGWDGAEWNMTPEQVASATAGRAPLHRGNRGDRLGGKEVRNVGEHMLAGARFRTVYYYDEAGLALVTLDRKSGDCDKIIHALVEQYGDPMRISDQAILRLAIWHDQPHQNRVRLMISQGLCNVHYERLSDYEAIDLAASREQ